MDTLSGAYPVTGRRGICGELRVYRSGLYTVFECECHEKHDRLQRVYVNCRGKRISIGVMTPRDGILYLRRKFTDAELRSLALDHVEACSVDVEYSGGWRELNRPEMLFADRDIADACRKLSKVLVNIEEKKTMIAVPFAVGDEFPLTELFCFASLERIGGKSYAVFLLPESILQHNMR